MLRVFLVDDEYFVRTSLKENIPWKENEFVVVGEANNGKTAFEQIMSLKPDIAIVDINMPGYNGIDLITLLQKEQVSCKYIILTGYNEFKYAKQAIHLGVHDYILKPIDYTLFLQSLTEIKTSIFFNSSIVKKVEILELENRQLLLNQYYNDLINCHLTTYSAAQYNSTLTTADFSLTYKAFTIAIIDFGPIGNPYDIQSLIIKNFIHTSFKICTDNKKRLFIILDSHESLLLPVYLQEIHTLLSSHHFETHIGVGGQYLNFEQIYLSYNEAEIALQNHSILNKTILYYDDLETKHTFTGLNIKTKHLLKTYILDNDFTKIELLINQIYEEFRINKITFNSILLYSIEFIYLLTEILSSQSSRPVSVLGTTENILDKLRKMEDIETVRKWILSTYTTSITNLLTESSTYSDVTLNIVNYIQENYSNPELSIPLIAEKLYLNYSYLCFCFKRDKGITINDYLNQVRIDKSIELLQSGIDNIGYIADKTGFNNAGYFSKRFKKAIGLSPSEYIKTINANS